MSSTPSLEEFDPRSVPYQYDVIEDIRSNFSYKDGIHEILLSGAVGSAKSILMAHLAVTHCCFYPGARVCLGRKSLPDLKDTIFTKILEHLETPRMEEGRDYWVNHTSAKIRFKNGSEIISRSWSDKKFKKFRSLELSMLIIEELTENEAKDFYEEASARVGRLPNIPEQLIICATNPDSPSHWAYEYFIRNQGSHRHVYYSVTTDNPFLPSWYKEQLESKYDPKMARRMIYGEWLAITQDVIYHQYDPDVHFHKNEVYKPRHGLPIHITYDFNIGMGKPLSCTLFQYDGHFHFFAECIVHGQRTEDSLEEMEARGLLDFPNRYIINGDCNGRNNDTRSPRSDYDIIMKFLKNRVVKYKDQRGRTLTRRMAVSLNVPKSNPRLRDRHNRMNGLFRNARGEVSIHLYAGCDMLDKGFQLTALKKGGQYLEDDSFEFQHVTTAAGYGVCSTKAAEELGSADSGSF
jgi:hypothetical protein